MGAIKDIYDILADVASKMKAHRLNKGKDRSREEVEAYAATLEDVVAELQAKVEDLQRENAMEVSELHAKITELEAENAKMKAKPLTLKFTGDPGIQGLY